MKAKVLEHGLVLVTNDRVYIGDVNGNAMEVVTMAHELNIGTINGMTVEEILDMMANKGIGVANPGVVFPTQPSLGAIIDIGDYEYRIVHIDRNAGLVYVALAYWHENYRFNANNSSTYAGSDIAAKCEDWYSAEVPQELKDKGVFVYSTVSGVTAACFIPMYNQLSPVSSDQGPAADCFDFYRSQGGRVFLDSNSAAHRWWCSTPHNGDSNYLWRVIEDGTISYDDSDGYNGAAQTKTGFRPHLAISISAFATGTVSA